MVRRKANEESPEDEISRARAYAYLESADLLQRRVLNVHFRTMRSRVKDARRHLETVPKSMRVKILANHLAAAGAAAPIPVHHFALCGLPGVYAEQKESWEKEFATLIADTMEVSQDQAELAFKVAYGFLCFSSIVGDPGKDATELVPAIRKALSAFTRKR